MKISPLEFYTKEKKYFETSLKKVKIKLKWISVIRFIIFCATIFFIYYFFGDVNLMIFSGISGSIIFLIFLKEYVNLSRKKEEFQELISINSIELNALKGKYFDFEKGEEFIDPTHFYSYDIDLFGRGSFFQFINRTVTEAGKLELAKLLTGNEIRVHNILSQNTYLCKYTL